jgi:TPR repeat protein
MRKGLVKEEIQKIIKKRSALFSLEGLSLLKYLFLLNPLLSLKPVLSKNSLIKVKALITLTLLIFTFIFLSSCTAPSWIPFIGQKSKAEDIPGEVTAENTVSTQNTATNRPPVPTQGGTAVPYESTANYSDNTYPAGNTPVTNAPLPISTSTYPMPASNVPAANTTPPKDKWKTPLRSYPEVLPGEEDFLNGNYASSIPLLLKAFYQGNTRGAFYARIIFQYGLDGSAPNLPEAEKALQVLTLRYKDIQKHSRQGPNSRRSLYQAALGLLYYKGLVPGQAKNLESARKWAEVAANSGFTPAMDIAAAIICDPSPPKGFLGIGTANPDNCFDWSMKAAEKGDILAMGNLSYLYREGIGTDKDPLKAVYWANKATSMNPPSARAQNDMGSYHIQNQGISQDFTEARRWFSLAQARYPLARQNLANIGKSAPAVQNSIDY